MNNLDILFLAFSCGAWLAVEGNVLRFGKGTNSGACANITIISRAEWGARAPRNTTSINVPVPEFFVHHTDTTECFNVTTCSEAVRNIQKFHMDDRGWFDIGYNFLVGEDGNVYEGRGWKYVGAHTLGYNSKSFGTSVIGNYMTKLPKGNALNALKNLIECGVELGKISPGYRLYGHRDANNLTDCPGDDLYHLIQAWPHYSYLPPYLFTLKASEGPLTYNFDF